MKLISFSNYIPEQIVDIVRFIDYKGLFRQSHYCEYAQSFIANILEDDDIDGAVFPNSCDSTCSGVDYADIPSKFIYQLKHPTVTNEASIRYFGKAIEKYRLCVEAHFKQDISISGIMQRTGILKKRGQYLFRLYSNIDTTGYGDYIKSINEMLSHPLDKWEKYAPNGCLSTQKGKRVYVIGPFLRKPSILSQIESCGLKIVGDNITNSKRLMYSDYLFNKDTLFEDIARHILTSQASVTASSFSDSWDKDYKEIKSKNVKGVIFISQKFCEPYDYLYTLYKQRLDAVNIPSIIAYVDDMENYNGTVWETFAEMI